MSSRNVITDGVGTATGKGFFDIKIFQSGYYNGAFLSRMQFSGYNDSAKTILNYINATNRF